MLAPVEGRLRQVAEPFLHDVYAATLATVHLAVRDGDEVLYLERMMGRTSVPIVSSVGSRLPMHCTGVGKVLLAFAPRQVQDHVFANLTRITPYTIVTPSVLSGQLERIRREAVATTSRGDVARRVFAGRTGRRRQSDDAVVAAIGVVVPSSSATANDCSAPCRSLLAASAARCDRGRHGSLAQWSTRSSRRVRHLLTQQRGRHVLGLAGGQRRGRRRSAPTTAVNTLMTTQPPSRTPPSAVTIDGVNPATRKPSWVPIATPENRTLVENISP